MLLRCKSDLIWTNPLHSVYLLLKNEFTLEEDKRKVTETIRGIEIILWEEKLLASSAQLNGGWKVIQYFPVNVSAYKYYQGKRNPLDEE